MRVAENARVENLYGGQFGGQEMYGLVMEDMVRARVWYGEPLGLKNIVRKGRITRGFEVLHGVFYVLCAGLYGQCITPVLGQLDNRM